MKTYLPAFLLGCAFFINTTTVTQAAETPNVIVILADDLGYGDLGCYNGKHKTPHLDKMASEGMRFTDFHSAGTVCSPSRAGLITGRYQQRSGVDGVINADPKHPAHYWGAHPAKVLTFPIVLKEQGYATALYGKWHLGYTEQFHPMHFGFDHFVGFLSGNIDYHSHYDRMIKYDWWHDRKEVVEEGYLTTLLTKHAGTFIKKNKAKPFCIFVHHGAVHSPVQGPTDPIHRGPNKANRARAAGRTAKDSYKDMLTELDRSVGEILATLKEIGLDKKTLVIFTSDNGPMPLSSAGELSGKKGSLLEGGHRVPTIAWWPGTIEPGVSAETCNGIDIMPTIFALADAKPPAHLPFDGVDLMPVFKGGKLKARSLFWMNSAVGGSARVGSAPKSRMKVIRQGPWKLIGGGKKFRLFNLDTDLAEKKDVAEEHPERVSRMKNAVLSWEAEVSEGLPYQVGEALKKATN